MKVSKASAAAARRFRRDVESAIGGVLFILGGLVTAGVILAPHSPAMDERACALMGLALVVVGVTLLLLPAPLAKRSPPFAVAAGIAAAAYGLYFNGERLGGEPLFNELFFFWPTLYVGYFFRPRAAAVALLAVAVAYLAVLSRLGLSAGVLTPRYVITMSSLVGIAVALGLLRRHVDRLVTQLRTLARTDVLTGLANRRAFDEALHTELERASRTGESFALLLGDVDHFKAINDRHGHAAGDQALAKTARLLAEHSRVIDTVARVGGEEFALILPQTDRAEGVQAAERLRTSLDDLTMSFGVVEAPTDGAEADDLLRAADHALYAAKAAGRDRTVAHDGPACALGAG